MSAATLAPTRRPVARGDRFTEKAARDLVVGDGALCRYYDMDGAYVEEVWPVVAVSRRRYGRGLRVTVQWSATPMDTTAYRGDAVLGVLEGTR